jgi:hypothetical protein
MTVTTFGLDMKLGPVDRGISERDAGVEVAGDARITVGHHGGVCYCKGGTRHQIDRVSVGNDC